MVRLRLLPGLARQQQVCVYASIFARSTPPISGIPALPVRTGIIYRAVEAVGPIRDYVGEHQRRHPREIAIVNLISISTKLGNDLSDAHAVPNQDGIREEAEATRFIHDVFQIVCAMSVKRSRS